MSGRLRKPTMTMATCKAVTLSIPREAAATHRKNARAADEPAWQAPHADPLHGEAEASSAPLSHGAGWKGEGRSCGATRAVGHIFSKRSNRRRSEEHTSELQSLMRISYAVFCLKKKKTITEHSEK